MRITRPRAGATVGAACLAIGLAVVLASWHNPQQDAYGGNCSGGNTIAPWLTITNVEAGHDNAPMYITDVAITPSNFSHTGPLPAYGLQEGSGATITVQPDAGYEGDVTIGYAVEWRTSSGHVEDRHTGLSATVHVDHCVATTTTTVYVSTTSTTTESTTTTASTATTLGTTTTTVCVSVGGDVDCHTTTTRPATTLPPSTTTTAPPTTNLIPPAIVIRDVPQAVPAAPSFTG